MGQRSRYSCNHTAQFRLEADLPALQVEEPAGRHVLWEHIAAVEFQQDREDDRVEDDVVLADEVHETGVIALPPVFPIRALVRAHCLVALM